MSAALPAAAIMAAGNAIIDELICRKGFRHVIDDLDEELLTEIKQDLGREALTAALPHIQAAQS